MILQTSPLPAAAEPRPHGGEATLALPDFGTETFLGFAGDTLLMIGLVICAGGLLFGMAMMSGVRKLPVHSSMAEVSDLIYATCKQYLATQSRFIMKLLALIGTVMVIYFGVLQGLGIPSVALIVMFALIGVGGSIAVAWFGIRVNNYANSRAAFASLGGRPYPTAEIPLRAGMSIGTVLISLELLIMLCILLFVPRHLAGASFIGFAIGESLGASALRIAGGIFTKIADIGADLMKIVFNIKEDDARNPGVIADCVGDNAGDSVGPSADGFETYGVTITALITFILIAIADTTIQVRLLTWIFVLGVAMVITSVGSYLLNQWLVRGLRRAETMDFEAPLTQLVRLTSLLSIGVTFGVTYLMLGTGDVPVEQASLWWKLAAVMSLGTLAGAVIPEIVKVFTSTNSMHVKEVVTASDEGGASLNVLAGLTAGNFSAYWLGMFIMTLMAGAYGVSTLGVGEMLGIGAAAPVFAFGLVAFGFLSMGPVTIAVDSYGPVTDNAQSVYELSTIEAIDGIDDEIERDFGFRPQWERAKHHLEANDGAGNTFKATAKPVLIGTAVVGATTMIFSIITLLTDGLTTNLERFSILYAPFLLGMIAGGAVIYWFTGASIQAVSTGAYRAVEFIRANIKLDGVTKASEADSRRVVEICTLYAQKGTVNIFLTVFLTTLGIACLDPYMFIGYLIALALFGLFQAVFMANAGGAWDNAKKVVEVDMGAKGTPLHAATVVGDTVGDPFKDTSSVALNPVIKFATLFGLLAVELAIGLERNLSIAIAIVLLAASTVFVWRSFYGMRIGGEISARPPAAPPTEPVLTPMKTV
jgi:K(+)-stimulated pyrophosphate-energized sodium pump